MSLPPKSGWLGFTLEGSSLDEKFEEKMVSRRGRGAVPGHVVVRGPARQRQRPVRMGP